MCGFGGAGAFSDGKFNFTTDFGGWLTDFLSQEEVMELIDYVDSINVQHGATTQCFSTTTPQARELEKKALEFDLHLLQARCKHLGTENNLRILTNIYEHIRDNHDFRFRTAIRSITVEADGTYTLASENGDTFNAPYLIAAPGRSGAEWFANQCKGLGLELINNQFEHITDVVYESKLVYRTKQYGDSVRTFCMNPYGHVVAENVEGINTVNGHSYSDPKLPCWPAAYWCSGSGTWCPASAPMSTACPSPLCGPPSPPPSPVTCPWPCPSGSWTTSSR